MTTPEARVAAQPVDAVPLFSPRLAELLESMLKGESPNAGRFCGNCYTPLDAQRTSCPHCGLSTAERPPVAAVPSEVLVMFRDLRRRESLIVNSFAYAGLALALAIFIFAFAIMFFNNAGIWWYIGDIAALFLLARVLPGWIGGWWGDDVGYRYSRRKLAADWAAYEAGR